MKKREKTRNRELAKHRYEAALQSPQPTRQLNHFHVVHLQVPDAFSEVRKRPWSLARNLKAIGALCERLGSLRSLEFKQQPSTIANFRAHVLLSLPERIHILNGLSISPELRYNAHEIVQYDAKSILAVAVVHFRIQKIRNMMSEMSTLDSLDIRTWHQLLDRHSVSDAWETSTSPSEDWFCPTSVDTLIRQLANQIPLQFESTKRPISSYRQVISYDECDSQDTWDSFFLQAAESGRYLFIIDGLRKKAQQLFLNFTRALQSSISAHSRAFTYEKWARAADKHTLEFLCTDLTKWLSHMVDDVEDQYVEDQSSILHQMDHSESKPGVTHTDRVSVDGADSETRGTPQPTISSTIIQYEIQTKKHVWKTWRRSFLASLFNRRHLQRFAFRSWISAAMTRKLKMNRSLTRSSFTNRGSKRRSIVSFSEPKSGDSLPPPSGEKLQPSSDYLKCQPVHRFAGFHPPERKAATGRSWRVGESPQLCSRCRSPLFSTPEMNTNDSLALLRRLHNENAEKARAKGEAAALAIELAETKDLVSCTLVDHDEIFRAAAEVEWERRVRRKMRDLELGM